MALVMQVDSDKVFLWEVLGSSEYFSLPRDADNIIVYIVQDEEVGREFIAELNEMKLHEVKLVNQNSGADVQFIERWSRVQ